MMTPSKPGFVVRFYMTELSRHLADEPSTTLARSALASAAM